MAPSRAVYVRDPNYCQPSIGLH